MTWISSCLSRLQQILFSDLSLQILFSWNSNPDQPCHQWTCGCNCFLASDGPHYKSCFAFIFLPVSACFGRSPSTTILKQIRSCSLHVSEMFIIGCSKVFAAGINKLRSSVFWASQVCTWAHSILEKGDITKSIGILMKIMTWNQQPSLGIVHDASDYGLKTFPKLNPDGGLWGKQIRQVYSDRFLRSCGKT